MKKEQVVERLAGLGFKEAFDTAGQPFTDCYALDCDQIRVVLWGDFISLLQLTENFSVAWKIDDIPYAVPENVFFGMIREALGVVRPRVTVHGSLA